MQFSMRQAKNVGGITGGFLRMKVAMVMTKERMKNPEDKKLYNRALVNFLGFLTTYFFIMFFWTVDSGVLASVRYYMTHPIVSTRVADYLRVEVLVLWSVVGAVMVLTAWLLIKLFILVCKVGDRARVYELDHLDRLYEG